jgi:hypothetical protein
MSHHPDIMVKLSARTKGSYTYVKDWMKLRECLAGVLGSMRAVSHRNVSLQLELPDGSPALLHEISGASQSRTKVTNSKAEAFLGDLRFGEKRDVLVQLVILPDKSSQERLPEGLWRNIIANLYQPGPPDRLEGGVPIIQAHLSWSNLLHADIIGYTQTSLLSITMLPELRPNQAPPLPMPPQPRIVQRRMEMLTSDMLARALSHVSRGQHARAQMLLIETQSILNRLRRGLAISVGQNMSSSAAPSADGFPPPLLPLTIRPNDGVDTNMILALEVELGVALEW